MIPQTAFEKESCNVAPFLAERTEVRFLTFVGPTRWTTVRAPQGDEAPVVPGTP
jgi:hypothetical protein